MRIETYDQSNLIQVQEIDEEALPPDYAAFSTSVFLTSVYIQLMEQARGLEVRSTLELLLVRLELKLGGTESDLAILKLVWDNIIDLTGIETFQEGDREILNSKAEITRMPFRFGEDYRLIILPSNADG